MSYDYLLREGPDRVDALTDPLADGKPGGVVGEFNEACCAALSFVVVVAVVG